MGTRDPRIDAYIAKSADFAQPILEHLRALVHAGCPDVVETIKWGMPFFEHQGPLANMAAFKAHCTFGFWKGKLLVGRSAGEDDRAMGQFGRITTLKDLPAKRDIVALVKRAAALNEDGISVPKAKKAPKPALETPDYLLAALAKNAKARKAFEAFPPSHRREYVEWIVEAKTDATREKRLAQTLEWLSEGKSRNWKYQK